MAPLTYAAIWALITQPVPAGGCGIETGTPAELMTRIVMHESGGNADTWNVNRNGTVDCGLAQINSGNWAWLGLDATSCRNVCRNLVAEATYLRGLSSYATGSPDKGFVLKPPGSAVSYVEDMAASRFKGVNGPSTPSPIPPPRRHPQFIILSSK
jgi:hypothetical protein